MSESTDLSVIIPVSGRYDPLTELHGRYRDALLAAGKQPEFVYVLDGQYDNALASLQRLQAAGERLQIVRLSRPFGEATALTMGVGHATAERLLLLPAYHQVEPEALPRLFEAPDADMVIARRWPRRDSRLNGLGTRLFHGMLRAVMPFGFRDIGCSARLVKRQVFDEVVIYGEQHRFLPVLAAHRGFRVVEVDLPQSANEPRVRLYRPGTYVRRLLDLLAVFFVVRFTKRPLRFFGLLGSALIVFGAAIMALVIVQRFVLGIPLADRPALLLGAILLVLGVQLFALGLIGELIIFTHARELKEYAVAETVNFGGDTRDDADDDASSDAKDEADYAHDVDYADDSGRDRAGEAAPATHTLRQRSDAPSNAASPRRSAGGCADSTAAATAKPPRH